VVVVLVVDYGIDGKISNQSEGSPICDRIHGDEQALCGNSNE
jgi:hypothetical protein